VSIRNHVYALLMLLLCGPVAQAATFCVTSGNQLNSALEAAEFNGQDDTIKVATGTHITDRYAPGDYQWKFEPAVGVDHEGALTISGGWNAANNCQTQSTLDPAQTVLDARYWGPVFVVAMVFDDFTGSLHISNLTFYRGESNEFLSDAAMRVVVAGAGGASVTFDNILVSGNRSGANFGDIGLFSLNAGGILKIRNSQFLNNSFTHPSTGGLTFQATNGAIGFFTNNSISGNTATINRKGLSTDGLVTLTNNAIGDNSSTADPSYDFKTDDPGSLTLNRNHFQTYNITGGSPQSETDTTTGDPAWSLVVARMVPDEISPLRDSGDNTPLGQIPNIDFSGQPRIVNVTIDRGAVEADAPPAVPTGPLVTAVSPLNGSTTVLQGNPGDFVSTQLTFDVSGGTAPAFTKLECSITSGDPGFGIASTGETVAVGGSITPIDVGFNLTSESQEGVITCELTRDNSGISYLIFNFIGVPPGGPAEFDSDPNPNPDPASTIQLTPGLAAVVGTDVFPKSIKLFNVADPGDSDLQVFCGPSGGSDPEIIITPPLFDGDLISPGGALEVSFDCDTSVAGEYFANYGCSYDLDASTNPSTTDGSAQFRVECDVRPPPKTEVETTPASGTLTSELIEPNDSASFDFSFQEVSPDPDPPADAYLMSCAIIDDTYGAFSIQSPAFPGGPYPIVNGSPVAVQVLGSDSAGQQLYTATLHCEYSDSAHPCANTSTTDAPAGPVSECGMADFPLELKVESDARFRVSKEFTDDDDGGPANPTEVDVTISCNTGLILEQTKTISQDSDVVFVVTSFDRGELNCEITEDTDEAGLKGYTPSYTSGGPDGTEMDNDGGCNFRNLEGGNQFSCAIVNDAEPVSIDIEKQWQIEGSGGDAVDQRYLLTLYCDADIDEGNEYCGDHGSGLGSLDQPAGYVQQYQSCKSFKGNGPGEFTAWVTPEWPGSNCWVKEKVWDQSVEIDNGCENLTVSHGEGDSCLITNTVFFEGVPTLSQWGLAITALLMLGMGLVGFRRFS